MARVLMRRVVDGDDNDPTVNPSEYLVEDHLGRVIDISQSQTQGLQEAIDAAAHNGLDLDVYGGAVKPGGVDPSIVRCLAGLRFPPWQKGVIHWQSITVSIEGGAPVGLEIDSMMACDFQWLGGQMVCGNALIGVLFQPHTELPFDPAGPVITTSRVLLPSIVMARPDAVCARFCLSAGNVGEGNTFEFIEPNGGAYGVQVLGGAAAFRGNSCRVYGAHAQSAACVAVGVGPGGAERTRGNQWQIECDPAPGAVGVDVWGCHDIYQLSVLGDEGPGAVALALQETARDNIVIAACLEAVVPLHDLSGENNLVIHGH